MYSETIFRMWFDSSFVSTPSSVRASKGDQLELRPLQYDSLLLVLPSAYSKDTRILGHYLHLNCPAIT